MPRFELGTARAIAVVLEFKAVPGQAKSLLPTNELDRMAQLSEILKNVNTPYSRGLVMANFCALYLPAVVHKVLVPSPIVASPKIPLTVQGELMLHNAYSEMLACLVTTPHFARYLRSQMFTAYCPKILITTLAWRLNTAAREWDKHLRYRPDHWPSTYLEDGPLVTILKLLFHLIISVTDKKLQEDIVPTSLRNKLLPWVSKWANQYPVTVPLGDYASRFRKIFASVGMSAKDLRTFKSQLKGFKVWDSCALWSCKGSNVELKDLKACSRCQTVRYCSSEHQKEDWKTSHKFYCFETDDY